MQEPAGRRSQRHVLADGEVIEYKDSATDIAFIAVVRRVRQLCPSTCRLRPVPVAV